MEINKIDPPRKFVAYGITLSHCADINLDDFELVTFITKEKKEYDVVARDWGFYATPSINGRLKNNGFKTALARSRAEGKVFVMIVDNNKIESFLKYLEEQGMDVIKWLDEEY